MENKRVLIPIVLFVLVLGFLLLSTGCTTDSVQADESPNLTYFPVVNKFGYCFICTLEDYEAGLCPSWCTPENWCILNRRFCREQPFPTDEPDDVQFDWFLGAQSGQ